MGMKDIKWIMLANCIMWIVCGVVVSVGVYFTKSPACLWFLLTPMIDGGYKYIIRTDDNKTHKID